MSIAPMKKVQIFVHESKAALVLKTLQPLEIIEITALDEDFFSPAKLTDISHLDFAELIDFFKQLYPEQKSFLENFIKVRPLLKAAGLAETIKQKKQILTQVKKIKALKNELAILQQRQNMLVSEIAKLKTYSYFDNFSAKAAKLKRVKVSFGSLTLKNYEKWQLLNSELPELIAQTEAARNTEHVFLVFCFAPEQETVLREKLGLLAYQEINLPVPAKPFAVQLRSCLQEQQKLVQQEKNIRAQLRKLYLTEKINILTWHDYLENEEKVSWWSGNLMKTKKVALIEGWIVKKRYPELTKCLSVFGADLEVVSAPHSEDDCPPVVLENGKMAPFESITVLYGLPNAKEFDPTPLLGFFFALFFGLCMSDVGYGLMLLILSIYLLKKYNKHLTGFGKNLLTLMIYCSYPTILVGIFLGSYFGMDLQIIPSAALRNLLLSVKLTDPVTNPLSLLIFSLIIGVVQIYFGLIVRFVLDLRQKDLKEAMILSGLWVFFVTGIIGWVIAGMVKITALIVFFKILFYISMLGLVATQGRHHKNPFMRFCSGVISLYRVSGFVGDILSYSRLFALGLVTSVLSMVINLLAKMLAGIPVIGGVLLIGLLFGGHIFNFFINILGSFVHPARLQYVEYFSKFFEGGGSFFRPFTWKKNYITIEK